VISGPGPGPLCWRPEAATVWLLSWVSLPVGRGQRLAELPNNSWVGPTSAAKNCPPSPALTSTELTFNGRASRGDGQTMLGAAVADMRAEVAMTVPPPVIARPRELLPPWPHQ